jgi:hypothetical protein
MEGKKLAFLIAVLGATVIGVGTFVLYKDLPPTPPPLPKPAPPAEVMMNTALKYSQPIWLALVESDAKNYSVPIPTLEELSQPNAYFEELRGQQTLEVNKTIETAHLRLSLEISKQSGDPDTERLPTDHLVLRIENQTPSYLAYLIKTAPIRDQACGDKTAIPHNAMVLEPFQTLRRTECSLRKRRAIDVVNIEVMVVTPLGAHYVSRVPPNQTLYEPRTSSGHTPPTGTMCTDTLSASDIQEGIKRGELAWKDIIDFYTRHNCDEYSFFSSYQFRVDPAEALPAQPQK